MTLDKLKNTLTIDQGELRVVNTTLSSDNLTALLSQYFPDKTLLITGASITSQAADPFHRIKGQAKIFSVNMEVVAEFYIKDEEAELELTATPPANWRFSDSFSSLQGNYFDEFVISSPLIKLESIARNNLPAGASLQSGFQPSPVWGMLEWFANPGANATLSGPIKLLDGVPTMILKVSPEIQSSLGGFLDVTLQMQHLSYAIPSDKPGGITWPTTYSQLLGDIQFSHNQTKVDVPLAATFGGDLSVLELSINTEDVFDLGLSEIAHWLGGVDLGTSALPDFYRPPIGLTLHDIVFAVGLQSRILEYITLHIQSTNDWVVIDRILEIEEIKLDFMVMAPGTNTQLALTIGGLLKIADIELEVHAQLPDFTIAGGLPPGTTADLSTLISNQLGTSQGVPTNLKIEDLRFSAHPAGKQYSFDLGISGDWTIVHGLSINGLSMDISYTGGIQTDLSAVFKAVFQIAGLDLLLSADYESTTSGWLFSGQTTNEVQIDIGTVLGDIATSLQADATLPDPLKSLTLDLKTLETSFQTNTKDFSFNAITDWDLNGKIIETHFQVDFKNFEDQYQKDFLGSLTLSGMEFDLRFSSTNTDKFFLASYENLDHKTIAIGNLINELTDANLLANDSWTIEIKDALFAYHGGLDGGPNNGSGFLLGLDMGTDINLAGLPLVGKLFPKDQSLKIVFTPIIASANFKEKEIAAMRAMVVGGSSPLPPAAPNANPENTAVKKGVGLTVMVRLGKENIPLSLPVSFNDSTGEVQTSNSPANAPSGANRTAPDGTKWFTVQKNFGPVSFQRFGLRFASGTLTLLLDASLSVGPLSLSLDGLGVSSPLSPIKPSFELHGLGLDFKTAAFEIGGAFQRMRITPPSGDPYDEYSGAALLRTEAFSLSAIGSFAYYEGHPSLFVYAVLDYPLGGPAFFFVTGLAAGFGYNRSLLMPGITEVQNFPLVSEATQSQSASPLGNTSSTDIAAKITNELTKLNQYIPPSVGQYFLAVGIKFTSFEMIDSFALLAVSFGQRFEIDLLGLSTAIIPTPELGSSAPAIAEVQLALKAVFLPDEGFLGVQAQLTTASYLLSRDCHLTGGFAFFTWFKDQPQGISAGDFVLTVGGYHPRYQVPAHYPKVPRLGINWKISDQLSITGDAYFALTAHALMAGGHLAAVWQDGALKAWFKAGADFLIAWKPYHYDAEIYVDIGIEFTFHFLGTHHISLDLGADLHIWGPEFSGVAKIHFLVFSFTVHFGHNTAPQPEPIDWDNFRNSFLPKSKKEAGKIESCTLNVQKGLIRKMDENGSTTSIVNPKDLVLTVDSVLPLSAPPTGTGVNAGSDIGIAPMAVTKDQYSSTLQISIQREGDSHFDDFAFTAIEKNVPAALWGQELETKLNGQSFIKNALTGVEIRPATPVLAAHTQPIDRKKLQFSTDGVNDSFAWEQDSIFQGEATSGRTVIHNTILKPDVAKQRNAVLSALGYERPNENIALYPEIQDIFLENPQLITLANA